VARRRSHRFARVDKVIATALPRALRGEPERLKTLMDGPDWKRADSAADVNTHKPTARHRVSSDPIPSVSSGQFCRPTRPSVPKGSNDLLLSSFLLLVRVGSAAMPAAALPGAPRSGHDAATSGKLEPNMIATGTDQWTT
jgi:hypothetical protein